MEKLDYISSLLSESALMQAAKADALVPDLSRLPDKAKDDLLARMLKENAWQKEQIAYLNTQVYGSKSQRGTHAKPGNETPCREQLKHDYIGPESEDARGSCYRKDDSGGKAGRSEDKDKRGEKCGSEDFALDRKKRGPYNPLVSDLVIEHASRMPTTLREGFKVRGERLVTENELLEFNIKHNYMCYELEGPDGEVELFFEPKDPEDPYRPEAEKIPHTTCTCSTLANIASSHFLQSLPVNRLKIKMAGDGLELTNNTISNWEKHGAEVLRPILTEMKKGLLKEGHVVHIDESWVKVRIKFVGDGTKLGKFYRRYVWCLVNTKAKLVYFFYDNDENDSRGLRPIAVFLDGAKVNVQSDAYTVYVSLMQTLPKECLHAVCWCHVRAKLKYASLNGKDVLALYFLEKIGYLYQVEAECLVQGLSASSISDRRKKSDVTKVMNELKAKASESLEAYEKGELELSETMVRALKYMLNNWDALQVYRENGDFSIDNLPAERAIRPFTVIRKNVNFFCSESGLQDALVYLTLIECAKMNGLDPKRYLEHVLREILSGNKDYASLIPGVVKLPPRNLGLERLLKVGHLVQTVKKENAA